VKKGGQTMKKTKLIGKILEIALVFVLIGTMLGGLPAFLNKVEASPGTIYVPDDYSTIQAAADASSPGDTIIVRAGTYTENIDVNKSDLTIDSESGADVTIIQAANSNDHVFHVYNVNGVRISGFTIKGATAELKGGISLDGANSCEIVDNVVSENWVGIGLYMARDNTIRRNTFSNNTYGGGVSEDPTTPCAVAEAVYEAGITAEPEETRN
jgi:parallel beta-helix repeat protein